jgi:cell wall-associated NlpC family hydrolase
MRADIVTEALTWLRTPYVPLANIKGAGVDCAMLLVEVFRAPRGNVPVDFDPRPYPIDWYLHSDAELYLDIVRRFGRRIDTEAQPGDILAYRYGHAVGHAAIVIDDNLVLHASRDAGNVALCERRTLVHRLDSTWSAFA